MMMGPLSGGESYFFEPGDQSQGNPQTKGKRVVSLHQGSDGR
jgi:hypothetical protein